MIHEGESPLATSVFDFTGGEEWGEGSRKGSVESEREWGGGEGRELLLHDLATYIGGSRK